VDYSFGTAKEGVLVLCAGGGRLAVFGIGTHSSVMGDCVWVVLFWDGTTAERWRWWVWIELLDVNGV
jgi:hypothetical protein